MKTQSVVIPQRSSFFEQLIESSGIPCEVEFASGEIHRYGAGRPKFFMTLHTDKLLLHKVTEFSLGRAYVGGDFELDGDMLSALDLRQFVKDRTELSIVLRFLNYLFLKSASLVNRKFISAHYNFGDDFYLTFIDNKYRFYSQCVFHTDDETLEQAAEHKLESMYDALQLRPGMRLLDIGAGWGGVHEYCGPRGVHVMSVTLSEDSFLYTNNLIDRMGFENCSVKIEDFLEHTPEQPYDAVVIYGVIRTHTLLPSVLPAAVELLEAWRPVLSGYLGRPRKIRYERLHSHIHLARYAHVSMLTGFHPRAAIPRYGSYRRKTGDQGLRAYDEALGFAFRCRKGKDYRRVGSRDLQGLSHLPVGRLPRVSREQAAGVSPGCT